VLTVLRRARDFRLLRDGQSASTIGDALVLVPVGLHVTWLTGDPSDVGLVLAAHSLPVVLFALVPRSTRRLERYDGTAAPPGSARPRC
jgi:hypothetical protein